MDIVDLKEIPEIIPKLVEWHHTQWAYLNPRSTLEKRLEKTKRYLCDEPIPSTFVAVDSGDVLGSAAIIEHDMDTRMEYSPWLASVNTEKKELVLSLFHISCHLQKRIIQIIFISSHQIKSNSINA